MPGIPSGVQPVDMSLKAIQNGNEFTMTSDIPEEPLRDPLEDMPEFSAAFKDANEIAKKKADEYKQQIGLIHVFWDEKQRVLKENYQIDWKSPAELNTHICYD